MESKSGFKSLPLSMKIFFIIMTVLTLLSFLYLEKNSIFIIGFVLRGVLAKIAIALVNIFVPTILLIAMLKRYSWTAKYATFYFGFLILNSVIGIISYTLIMPDGLFKYLWSSIAIGASPNIALIIFLIIFWRGRNYFTKNYE